MDYDISEYVEKYFKEKKQEKHKSPLDYNRSLNRAILELAESIEESKKKQKYTSYLII